MRHQESTKEARRSTPSYSGSGYGGGIGGGTRSKFAPMMHDSPATTPTSFLFDEEGKLPEEMNP